MQEFTIKDVVRIFQKWWILITALPLITVIISGYYNYQTLSDIYLARTSLFILVDYVDNVGNMRYDMAASRDMATNLGELFVRSTVLRQTVEEMEMPDLLERVTFRFTSLYDTSMFDITATGSDPELCAAAANTASEVLTRYVDEIIQKECTRITHYASVPKTPIGPQRTQNILISAGAALLIIISAVLVIEIFNQRIKTDEQVESGLHLPVLGGIPNIRGKMKPYEKGKETPMQGIVRYIGNLERESFKSTAANISFVAVNPTAKTFAIASIVSDDGMDAFMMLMAHSFSETGKSVLLVDMDYRDQSLGPFLRHVTSFDMVDHLAGRAAIGDIISKTSMFNVSFIGNNHSSTLFTRVVESEGFSSFLREAESMFDVILFNTPPLDLYIDAAVLASKVGGTVLVIPSNRVDVKHAKAAVEQIRRGGATVLGVVLNDVKNEKIKAYQRRTSRPFAAKKA